MKLPLTKSDTDKLLNNLKKARLACIVIKEKREKEYYENPNRCINCKGIISYKNKHTNKFCSHSCAAIYNNNGRIRSNRKTEICPECGKEFYANGRKYCSNECLHKKNRYEKYSLDEILVKNSTYKRNNLKIRLIKLGLLKNICSICKLSPEWNGRPLNLIIDHINGIYNDNRLENLRLVCPNCDSQLPTFSGRNKKYKKNIILL